MSEESKRWIADPANRVCDAPGSWYCAGQYPPALKSILAEKRDFSQLEDFNKKNKIEDDTEYQRKYFEDMKYVSRVISYLMDHFILSSQSDYFLVKRMDLPPPHRLQKQTRIKIVRVRRRSHGNQAVKQIQKQ